MDCVTWVERKMSEFWKRCWGIRLVDNIFGRESITGTVSVLSHTAG